MERSVGADALLNESWATPWLDEGVFPYWPEATRIGDLEDFLRWLALQDGHRAALVLTHVREFEKVYRLVTTEVTKAKQQQQQQPQQQRRYQQQQGQQHRYRSRDQSPQRLVSSTGVRAPRRESRAATSRGLASSDGGERRRDGGVSSVSLRSRSAESDVCPPSYGRRSSAAEQSNRLSATSVGGVGNRGLAAVRGMPAGAGHSWPPPSKSAAAAAAAVAGRKPHDARYPRHSSASIVPPPPAVRSRSRSRAPEPRSRTAQPPASLVFRDSNPPAVYRRSSDLAHPTRLKTTRQRGSLGEEGVGAGKGGGGGGGSSSSSTGGCSGRSTVGGRGSGSGSGSGSDVRTINRDAYGTAAAGGVRLGPSWEAIAAAAAVAAAGRTAAVRQTVEEAAAEAEAAEAAAAAAVAGEASVAGPGRGKRGRGGLSPEKQAPSTAGRLGRRLPRRSPPPVVTDKVGGGGGAGSGSGSGSGGGGGRDGHGLNPGEQQPLSPPHGPSVPHRAGDPQEGPVGRRSPDHPVRFQRSPIRRRLRDIDEETGEEAADEMLPPPPPPPPSGEEEDKEEKVSENWLCMRDPVSQREFWFDPKTRAAEWKDGGSMEDAPGGLGLGLLSQEDRERLRGKFERRQRRVRHSSGVGGLRGTAGLREQVLRKLTLEGDSGDGGAEAFAAAPAAPVRRGAASRGVFFG